MCLWLYSRISLSFSSTWFKSFGLSGILHSYVHGEVRAALLNDCKSPFVVEAGASQGYFSRCDFETFEIKPVDPSIARVAWGVFLLIDLVFFFLLFVFLVFLRFDESRKLQLEVWRKYIFFAQAPRGPWFILLDKNDIVGVSFIK